MIWAIARLNIKGILSILLEKTERSDTTNLQSSIPASPGWVVTLNAGVIIVCTMLNNDTTGEYYNHEPQTFHEKITDNIITTYVDFKPYAWLIHIGCR